MMTRAVRRTQGDDVTVWRYGDAGQRAPVVAREEAHQLARFEIPVARRAVISCAEGVTAVCAHADLPNRAAVAWHLQQGLARHCVSNPDDVVVVAAHQPRDIWREHDVDARWSAPGSETCLIDSPVDAS